jgi:hypothetical protein
VRRRGYTVEIDIVGHEKYTEGWTYFRKSCGKARVPCLLGNARNKPHSASKPNARHIPPEQQQQNFEEEYSASRKGGNTSKSALNFMHTSTGDANRAGTCRRW